MSDQKHREKKNLCKPVRYKKLTQKIVALLIQVIKLKPTNFEWTNYELN